MADLPAAAAPGPTAASPLRRILASPAARRFLRNRGAMVGLVLVACLAAVAVLGPVLAAYDPVAPDLRPRLRPPSAGHRLRTDGFGRGIPSRVVYCARSSLVTGLVRVLTGLVVGTAIGLLAGFFRGWIDDVLMRVMDVLLAFPSLLLALAVVETLGPGLVNAVIAASVVSVPGYARLARSLVIAAREEEY